MLNMYGLYIWVTLKQVATSTHPHWPKTYLHPHPPIHKKCPATPTHQKYTSTHPPPTHKKCLPTTTHPKYTSKFDIYNHWFNFPNNASEIAESWCILSFATILRLLQMKKLHFSLSIVFYCYFVMFATWGLVAYELVAYKNRKCK